MERLKIENIIYVANKKAKKKSEAEIVGAQEEQ